MPEIGVEECPWPHNSKQYPLCSPLKRDRKVEAKCICPGIPSILIPKEYKPKQWITSRESTHSLNVEYKGKVKERFMSNE